MEVVGRDNHGKRYLNPDEVERLRMNGSRAAQIAFKSLRTIEASQEVDLIPGLIQWSDNNQKWFPVLGQNKPKMAIGSHSDTTFDLHIFDSKGTGSRVVTVPYGLIQECWKSINDRMCIMLQLDLGMHMDGTITFVRR